MKFLNSVRVKLRTEITAVPQPLQGEFYTSLHGLRGVAILLVLFPHFGINRFLAVGFRLNGQTGVYLFFVLSGFLITTLLLKQKVEYGKINLTNFYLRRVLRIVPLVYLFLFILTLISIYFQPLSTKKDLIYSFLFLKNLPIPNDRFTAHLWTIAVEMQFYIIFPFLLALSVNRYLIIALSLIILFPLLSIISFYLPDFYSSSFPLKMLFKVVNYAFWKGPVILLIGSVASLLTFKNVISFNWSKKYEYLSFFLLLVAVIICTTSASLYYKYISECLCSVMIAAVILINLHSENFLTRILNNPILMKIGVLSYSLYIWQQIFIGGLFRIPGLMTLNTLPFIIVIMVKFALIFPIAYISYYFFETPFLKYKERFK